jgi:tetratricopeptide (TPR) repeat protein
MMKFNESAPVAHYYLGRGLAALGRNEEAIHALEQSAHADSGEVASRSYYELTRLYRKMQRVDDAQKSLAEYKRLKESADKKSALQVEGWRKFNANNPQPKAN